MTAKKIAAAPDYGVAPSKIVTAETLAERKAPWVFQMGAELYALKSLDSITAAEFDEIMSTSEKDVPAALQQLAFDPRTAEYLAREGLTILLDVFTDWMDDTEIGSGNSNSSGG